MDSPLATHCPAATTLRDVVMARGPGQPTKLTPARAKAALREAEAGNPREVMANAAGVVLSTIQLWLRKGRAGDPTYSEFSRAVDEAAAKEVGKDFEVIRKIRDAKDEPGTIRLRAAQLGIQAFHPHMFSPPAGQVKVTAKGDEIEITVGQPVEELSDEDLMKELKA